MPLAFVEELGHDYEAQLVGAIEEADEPAAMEMALAVVGNEIKISIKKQGRAFIRGLMRMMRIMRMGSSKSKGTRKRRHTII